MSNQTSTQRNVLRRTMAGILAAGALAFGGMGTLSASDAQAAGVRQQTYVVQSSSLQVQADATPANRSKE
ncbi:hypothetical protein [Luteococcus peritonei]|uniref:Uncharacterized protein n=1 Tax=Luteococcus peritonei TaxID=88874 RepID=A0ABW4RT42_9ACTN